MGILENIKDWFTSETSRNKNSSLIAGLLVRKMQVILHQVTQTENICSFLQDGGH